MLPAKSTCFFPVCKFWLGQLWQQTLKVRTPHSDMGNYSEPHCFLAWLQTWSPPRNDVHSLPIFGMKRDVHQLGGKPKLWSVKHFDFGWDFRVQHSQMDHFFAAELSQWHLVKPFQLSAANSLLRWFSKVQRFKASGLSARYSGVYPSNPLKKYQTSKCQAWTHQ